MSTASTCRPAEELIAHGRTDEEVCRLIGADWLVYQDLDDLIDAARRGNPNIRHFDTSCFDGVYVTGDVNEVYLKKIGALRSDEAKTRRESNGNALNDLSATG